MISRTLPLLLLLPWLKLTAAPSGVRFLAWDEQIAARKLATGGADIAGLHPLQRTTSYKITLEDGKFLVQAMDKKNEKGEPLPLVVRIPDNMLQPLVLLLPKPDAPTGLTSLVIEDDESSLKWGDIRAFNSTGQELAMSVGTSGKLLPPGWKPVDFQPAADQTVSLLVAVPEEFRKPAEARKLLFSTVWTGESNVRSLAIIVPGTDARLGPLAVKVITEDKRVLAAEKVAAQKR